MALSQSDPSSTLCAATRFWNQHPRVSHKVKYIICGEYTRGRRSHTHILCCAREISAWGCIRLIPVLLYADIYTDTKRGYLISEQSSSLGSCRLLSGVCLGEKSSGVGWGVEHFVTDERSWRWRLRLIFDSSVLLDYSIGLCGGGCCGYYFVETMYAFAEAIQHLIPIPMGR